MDHDELEALLRREGMRADELEALVAWARQRARALTADLHAPAPTLGLRSVAIDVAWSSPAAATSTRETFAPRSSHATANEPHLSAAPEGRPRGRGGAPASVARRSELAAALLEAGATGENRRVAKAKTEVINLSEDAFLEEAFAVLTGDSVIPENPSEELELLEGDALELVEEEEAPMSDGVPAWRAALLSAELALR